MSEGFGSLPGEAPAGEVLADDRHPEDRAVAESGFGLAPTALERFVDLGLVEPQAVMGQFVPHPGLLVTTEGGDHQMAAGPDHRDDLARLRRYAREYKPVVIAVVVESL